MFNAPKKLNALNIKSKLKSLKKTSVVLMTALFLTSMFPQEANAGHKKKYGHSWVSCMWAVVATCVPNPSTPVACPIAVGYAVIAYAEMLMECAE